MTWGSFRCNILHSRLAHSPHNLIVQSDPIICHSECRLRPCFAYNLIDFLGPWNEDKSKQFSFFGVCYLFFSEKCSLREDGSNHPSCDVRLNVIT